MPSEISTPLGDAPVIPLVILGTGMYLTWFGVHYWRSDTRWPTDPVKAVLTGKPVPGQSSAPPESAELTADIQAFGGGSGSSGTAAAGATGSSIADDALKYKGAGYVWGGNASSTGNWDCSSFVSYVLGHDLGLPLPGGHWGDPGFPPHAHGPTTVQYMLYGTGINLKDVQAGDLIVSTEHMGIAISPTQMISAQDPQLGTGTGTFPAGFPGGPPVYRRVNGGSVTVA